jgi:hypothetical protein
MYSKTKEKKKLKIFFQNINSLKKGLKLLRNLPIQSPKERSRYLKKKQKSIFFSKQNPKKISKRTYQSKVQREEAGT